MRKLLLTISCITAGLMSAQSQVTLTLQPGAAAGKDAELFSCGPCGYATRNFGNKPDLNAVAWTNNGNKSNIRSLIQFDLSAIPVGAVITDAKLSLYYNSDNQEGSHFSTFFYKNTTVINRVTSNWDESTVTWNNQPSVTTQNQVTLAASTSSTQSYPNINVTALVRDMVSNPSQSFGFRLKMKAEDQFRKLLFASSDHPNAALRPKLVITYTVPPVRLADQTVLQATEDMKLAMVVYPNPVRDEVKVSITTSQSQLATLQISDLSGRMVYRKEMLLNEGMNAMPVPVAEWRRGIYLVSVRSGSTMINEKLVVE